MHEFRLSPDGLTRLKKRIRKTIIFHGAIAFLFSVLIIWVIDFVYAKETDGLGLIYTLAVVMLFLFSLFRAFYAYRFRIKLIEHFFVRINDQEIVCPFFETQVTIIPFNAIKRIKSQKDSCVITTRNIFRFIEIPYEIENFEEIRNLLKKARPDLF